MAYSRGLFHVERAVESAHAEEKGMVRRSTESLSFFSRKALLSGHIVNVC